MIAALTAVQPAIRSPMYISYWGFGLSGGAYECCNNVSDFGKGGGGAIFVLYSRTEIRLVVAVLYGGKWRLLKDLTFKVKDNRRE